MKNPKHRATIRGLEHLLAAWGNNQIYMDDRVHVFRALQSLRAVTGDLGRAVNIGLAALGHFNTEQRDDHWNAKERELREIEVRNGCND